jgi:hypothetical protein
VDFLYWPSFFLKKNIYYWRRRRRRVQSISFVFRLDRFILVTHALKSKVLYLVTNSGAHAHARARARAHCA